MAPTPKVLRSRALPTTLAVAWGLAGLPWGLPGQEVTVRVEENLRAEPNGVVIAVLEPGSTLDFVRRRGRWVEATFQGWVWTQSLLSRDRGSFDLTVGAAEGENLRERPNGPVLARLEEGTLLQELERIPGWVRVQRTGWVWGPSVDVSEPAPAASGAAAAGTGASPPGGAGTAGTTGATGIFRAPAGAAVLASPDGDTLAALRDGVELAVTARRGNWARVRAEGWVWAPPEVVVEADPTESEGSVTPSSVAADPERFLGRIVTWEVQFVSLERAESVRTDFYEGEPFLLTRVPSGTGASFVYVAVPPERLGEVEDLTPLERLTVVGRIRAGASALTGSPILDLIELRPAR